MGMFRRIEYIIRGKAEGLLDKLEDPEQQLSVFINELNDQVLCSQRAVAAAVADEKRLKQQVDDGLDRAKDWENRAILALRDGNEALAKEALLKKEECEAQSLALQKGWTAQREATDKLKASLQTTRQRVAEAKRKYTLLVAQYKSAEAKKKVNASFAITDRESPMALMEKLSDKIARIEADTDAMLEMSGEGGDTDLEAAFATLERKQKGDDALQQLKAKLAGTADSKPV
jgi:phage shock protein A